WGTLHRGAACFILRARNQLLRSLRLEAAQLDRFISTGFPSEVSGEEAVLRALLAAFPDRVARRREAGGRRGGMVGGRGVRLAPSSGVTESELFVCVDVDAGQTETLVRQASAIQRDWLPVEQLNVSTEVAFDSDAERVSARRRVCFEELVIEETAAALP